MIAAVVITHNRLERLRLCVERVLQRASPLTTEIVVWDNASDDGTRAYLESLDDPRITPVLHDDNVGQNGYARGFRLTTAPYLVDLDDDVVDAPLEWDRTLLDAFKALDNVGFLAADIADDPTDKASYIRHHVRQELYTERVANGVRLLDGPAGGACAMTSRALMEQVGGFPEYPDQVFFLEDQDYIFRLHAIGYGPAVLADLQVHHQGGPSHAYSSPEKRSYWKAYKRRLARRNAVKRVLLRVPLRREPQQAARLVLPPRSPHARRGPRLRGSELRTITRARAASRLVARRRVRRVRGAIPAPRPVIRDTADRRASSGESSSSIHRVEGGRTTA